MTEQERERLYDMVGDPDAQVFVQNMESAGILVPFLKLARAWGDWQAEGECEMQLAEESLDRVFAAFRKLALENAAFVA